MLSIGFSCRACPSTRRGKALAACGLGVVVAVGLTLGFLAGTHFSPCNPRNLHRCARPLSSTLLGLDAVDAVDAVGGPTAGRDPAEDDAAALCPSLAEAVDCYFWFSQRCLPPREHHFYSKVYGDASAVVQGLCRPDSGASLLVRHGPCLRSARTRRSDCNERFLERLRQGVDDGEVHALADSLVDSLYDVDAAGRFHAPLCRALSEYILCGLRLVGDTCGIAVALRIHDLHDNLTSLVFNSKCDASLKPVFPGPAATPDSVDLVPATPGAITLLSLLALLLPVLTVIVRRLIRRKK